jgi:elongation factor 2
MAKESMLEKVKRLISEQDSIRNMAIVAHIDHGKTTLSDSLLAGAGMLSMETAGGQRYLDFMDEEQERGITIQASNVNMVHEVGGKEFLIRDGPASGTQGEGEASPVHKQGGPPDKGT